mgnify:CR=1 FL=1
MSVSNVKADAIKNEIGTENYELLQRMNYLKQSKGVQAMMPYHLNVE